MPADRLLEFVAALLIVTSFTVIGWLALWAAFSTAHWFARTLVILTCLTPLFAAAAYEAVAAFALQCGLIVLAIQFGRWWTIRKRLKAAQVTGASTENLRPISWRFSIMTLLQFTVLVAVGSWVALQLPRLNAIAWTNVCYIAGAAAMSAMAGALLSVSKKNLLRFMAIVGCLLVGAERAWFDWFLPSLTGSFTNWPPDPPTGALTPFVLGVPKRPIVAWFFIPVTIALLTALFVSLQIRAFPAQKKSPDDQSPPNRPNPSNTRRRDHIVLAALTLLVITFPLCVLGELLNPDAIPITTTPHPNGHDDLIAAAKIVETTAFGDSGNFDYETATQQALVAEVGKCGAAYELVAQGISKECLAPVNYSSSAGNLPLEDLQRARNTARALAGRARLAELQGYFDDSASTNVQTIQFGNNVRHGGMIVDALVGIACAGQGTESLYKQRGKLSSQQLDDCINKLARLDANDEPYADVWQRDRVWTQRAFGWHGHLHQILDDLADNHVNEFFRPLRGYEYIYWSSQARLRLLICELALTRYHQDNKHSPHSLDDLVPKYLPGVPADPLSPSGDALKYRRTNDGYVLYSVGPNCLDDNGASPAPADSPLTPESGDLRLDWTYGAHDDGTGQTPAAPQSPPSNNQSPTTNTDAIP